MRSRDLFQHRQEWLPPVVTSRRMPGYARRLLAGDEVVGDVLVITSTHVSGTRHDNGRKFTWKRGPEVELLEFGSFNPASDNYMEGGRPWTR